jgi:hypothetical protein
MPIQLIGAGIAMLKGKHDNFTTAKPAHVDSITKTIQNSYYHGAAGEFIKARMYYLRIDRYKFLYFHADGIFGYTDAICDALLTITTFKPVYHERQAVHRNEWFGFTLQK